MNIVVNFIASFYLYYDNRMKLNEKHVTKDDGNGRERSVAEYVVIVQLSSMFIEQMCLDDVGNFI